MKKDMPLEGLRWSRDSGSALYDTPQNGRSRTGWGVAFYSHTPFLYQLSKTLKTCCYCASFICRNNSFCFSFKPVGNFTL